MTPAAGSREIAPSPRPRRTSSRGGAPPNSGTHLRVDRFVIVGPAGEREDAGEIRAAAATPLPAACDGAPQRVRTRQSLRRDRARAASRPSHPGARQRAQGAGSIPARAVAPRSDGGLRRARSGKGSFCARALRYMRREPRAALDCAPECRQGEARFGSWQAFGPERSIDWRHRAMRSMMAAQCFSRKTRPLRSRARCSASESHAHLRAKKQVARDRLQRDRDDRQVPQVDEPEAGVGSTATLPAGRTAARATRC